MQDGNHAYALIQNQLTPLGVNQDGGGTYNNLFDAHPPFQIDGNFGCTSGITEMIMQSSDGAIHLLPALPDALKNGSISGLKARGSFTISDLEWKDGKLIRVRIHSELGGNLRLRTPNEVQQIASKGLKKAKGKNPNPFYFVPEIATPLLSEEANIQEIPIIPTHLYDVATEKNTSYTFQIKN